MKTYIVLSSSERMEWAQIIDHSHNIGKALAGAGEPPVAEEKDEEGEGGEVGETAPVGGGAVQENVPVAAYQGGERVEIDEGAKLFRDEGFWINYGRQVHPRH